MADTADVNSIDDDSAQPPDDRAEAPPEPAPRKPLTNSWFFPVAGGLFGAYFVISGALMVRDKHGNGVFALLVAGIVLVVAAFAGLLYRSYRAERSGGSQRRGRNSRART